MKKNSEIHLKLETLMFEKLKRQAQEESLSISELCRRKINDEPALKKIELILSDLNKKINIQLNLNRRLKW